MGVPIGTCDNRNVVATYRLQLRPSLPFERVCTMLPYFRRLGISHLYLSPCLKAAAGSSHGYDVVDPSEADPQLGGQEGFDRLCRASAELGIGLVVDIVPNHMAVAGRQNRWWWDVLAEGPQSRHAGFFDIRWDHPDPLTRNKVLLPVLGDEIEHCLESGEIRIRRHGPDIFVSYFEHEFPISKRSRHELLRASTGASNHPGTLDETADRALDRLIAAINAEPVRLKGFLDLQHYRLVFWRRANRDINYRRFFDIHQLAGVCVENPDVFAATHGPVLRWVNAGQIGGLRIDHPDGLRDPTAYLQRLRSAAPRAWVVVEKILEPGEVLDPEWPVAGTTGYDFLNLVSGLFVDPRSERLLTGFYGEFTRQPIDYRDVVHEKKAQVLALLFGSELSHLADLLPEESRSRSPSPAGVRREDARRALAEVIACFPVYRTYIRPDTREVRDKDRAVVRKALAEARRRQPGIASGAWRLIEDILLLKRAGRVESEFVWRFQQLTGPVMAKGVEDTSFYCFNRLISLNEVGGNPGEFGTSPAAFHAYCLRIQSQWPRTLLASATHDTKRGEDARLRIGLLSEIPERWVDAVRRWSRMNGRFRRNGFPDPNTEYFLYQILAGAWPIGCDRLVPVMLKAAKEAKVYTSWTDSDPAYEEALRKFVEGVLGHAEFTADLAAFLEPLAWPTLVTSLSQTLIKCTAPGVPDIYQGTELWDRNLVDPDNRRPVDFDLRRRRQAEISTLSLAEILDRQAEGLPKLFLLQRVLSVRRRMVEAFGPQGDYRPLTAAGMRSGHLVAFMRGGQAVILSARLAVGLAGDWKDTVIKLPAGTWENVFTGERFSGTSQYLSRILKQFPVALLAREGDT
ncbi:MAG: malto-oligosyltrehalose synthase [Hyphomicrobiales bacterium]